MQLPETTIANQSFLKTGFRNASHVEVFSGGFSMGGVVELKLFKLVVSCKEAQRIVKDDEGRAGRS